MKKTIFGMSIAAAILTVITVYSGGFSLLIDGIASGASLLLRILPILLLAFLVAGYISELISEEMIYRWLGKNAGWKGPLIGTIAGALVPGGPFFFYPLLATLVASGASTGTIMSFVAAKTLWSVGRIPLEIALVGAELTAIRLVITVPFSFLIGLLIHILLPDYSEKIRKDVNRLQMKGKEGGLNG